MNALIRIKKPTPVLVMAFVLAWFALSPAAQAVVPPPDGGYPGFNTAEGQNALFSLTTGAANTAVGWFSLFSDTEGSFNTATGAGTLLFNTANNNTAFGAAALLFNMTGSGNTATGAAALLNNTAGTDNTAVGASALINSIGSGNIALGANAGANVVNANNVICIGAVGEDTNGTCFIGNIFNEPVFGGTAVFITPKGRLGTILPSRRLTKDIQSVDEASEAIYALKPVTFHYKSDASGTPQFGFGALLCVPTNCSARLLNSNVRC
jgi:hypothetical protein